MSTARRHSGPGGRVTDAQRHTERITLRLPREPMARLRDLAARKGLTLAGVVALLVLEASRGFVDGA